MPKKSYSTLTDPPITEAVIEIRFSPAVAIETLESLCGEFKSDFPEVKPVRQNTLSWQMKGQEIKSGPQESHLDHYRLSSSEGRETIQLKVDRFAFSFIGYYTDWKDFSQRAVDSWAKFANKIPVELITRLGVRFVNNLNLPQGIDLNKYIANLPQVPEGVPAKMAGFLNQITMTNIEISAFGSITLALDRNRTNEKTLPVIIDIDVFNLESIPNQADLLNKKLIDLRNFKNQIFFSSLTENGLGLYK